MPKSENQKLKILYIMDYLQQHSHQGHPVPADALIKMLASHDIQVERKTIYSDIKALIEYGLDVVTVPGRKGGYYINASDKFDVSQLKLLVTAILSSRYLTSNKARELIEKLCKYCGTEKDAELIKREMIVSGRVRSTNEAILTNIELIQSAISQGKKITFRYFDWSAKGEKVFREKKYLASPYGLCQDNENCYVMTHTDEYGVTSYRVDRMDRIDISTEKRTPCPELTGKALIEQANRRFHMYSGEIVTVKMRFHKSLINPVFDRFGKDILLIPDGPEHYTMTGPVAVSPMFLSWIIGFGKNAKILYPESVVEQYKQLCKDVLSQFD